MTDQLFNELFLCTGNSARSIFGERLIERWGGGRFRGFSAGSHPKGEVHPLALEVLRQNNYPVDGLRSKHWGEFAQPGAAPRMDFVLTVCDSAAAEVCPVWPGQPITAHWGVADPAAAQGDELARIMAFRRAFAELQNRVSLFVSLPFKSLDRMRLQRRLHEIGRVCSEGDEAPAAWAGGEGAAVSETKAHRDSFP
jgi:arsenate reductase